jgi:hypothetical protein
MIGLKTERISSLIFLLSAQQVCIAPSRRTADFEKKGGGNSPNSGEFDLYELFHSCVESNVHVRLLNLQHRLPVKRSGGLLSKSL